MSVQDDIKRLVSRNDVTICQSDASRRKSSGDVLSNKSDVRYKQYGLRRMSCDVKSYKPDVKNRLSDARRKSCDAFKPYDVLYKVLVIGESNVGKSAFINKYQNPEKPLPSLLPTIGIDYRLVDMVIDGLRVRVQLWDTVGQERYS